MKKNLSSFTSNFSFQEGFTLIELLVSLGVLISVGVVTVGILTSALRGSNKASAVNNIRQNGSYAIIQMSRAVQYANTFNGVSVDGTAGSFTTSCAGPASLPLTPTPIPTQYKYVKITSFDGGQTVFSCSTSTIASNSASLLDTSSVALDSCSFTCKQEGKDFPIIEINFTLSQKGSGNFAENKITVPFGTSITIRNPQR